MCEIKSDYILKAGFLAYSQGAPELLSIMEMDPQDGPGQYQNTQI